MSRTLAITLLALLATSCRTARMETYTLDYDTPVHAGLQKSVEAIDANLRKTYGMTIEPTAVGVLDLNHLRLAMIHPDRIEYAASIPKIGILLA